MTLAPGGTRLQVFLVRTAHSQPFSESDNVQV